MAKPDLTHERLCELLFYDPTTGLWTWIVSRSTRKAGSTAGTLANGYIMIRIDGSKYSGHRLAFLWMTGTWPENDVDHRNLCKADNRWSNIREATESENAANIGAHRDNRLGVKGVDRLPGGKYRAVIKVAARQFYLGTWGSAEMASWMYGVAAHALFGEFARAA
jgi:hypothetical protein